MDPYQDIGCEFIYKEKISYVPCMKLPAASLAQMMKSTICALIIGIGPTHIVTQIAVAVKF